MENHIRLTHLNKVIIEGIDIINPIDVGIKQLSFSHYEYLHHSIFRRYQYNLAGVYYLVNQYITHDGFLTPLSVVLRTALLDFITQCYLLSAHPNYSNNESTTEYDSRVQKVWFSALLREIKSIEKQKSANSISEDDYLKQLQILHKNAPLFFKSFDTASGNYDLVIKNEISTIKMYHSIMENKRFKQYKAAYDLYDFYSKIEHFGVFSNFIIALHKTDKFLHSNRIIHTIIIIFRGIVFSIEQSSYEKKKEVLQALEKLGEEFIKEPLKKMEKKDNG